MNGKVVTFGEVMMRLSPVGQARLHQTHQLNILYAGSEANVASSLALFGIPAAHVTCFPANELGYAASASLRKYGVDTKYIVYTDGRIGVYFIEHGASVRSPRIIYDRFDSCFANLDPSQFDWAEILLGASWFHWSGITPAISQSAANACLEAIQTARKLGVKISGDINYRRNLWQYGKGAQDVMPELISMCDVVIAGITDFENCLGISGHTFEAVCENVVKEYPAIKKVCTTVRETISASHNTISAKLWDGTNVIPAKNFNIQPIVDRVGAGDAFMAGLLYGWINDKGDQYTIDFATGCCAFKHTIEGDVNLVSVNEVETFLKGENIGKLLR